MTLINELYKSIAYDRVSEIALRLNGFFWAFGNTYAGFLRMNRSKGFGLLELMITLVIASLLLSLAIPSYDKHVQRAKITKACGDIATLSIQIERFRLKNQDRVPTSLDELGVAIPVDPWGEPYQYLNIANADPGNGAFRKDGKLNPLNSDFDLYSMGKDGDSKGPLSAKASLDDIVRANNGAYIGLGANY